jgi:hypothetical protein
MSPPRTKDAPFTEAREDWLTVVRLPGYALDLNAVESAWSAMKSGLGNHTARTLDELGAIARGRLLSGGAARAVVRGSAGHAADGRTERGSGTGAGGMNSSLGLRLPRGERGRK